MYCCIRISRTGFVPVGCRICGPEVAGNEGLCVTSGDAFERGRETVNLCMRGLYDNNKLAVDDIVFP